MSGSIQLTGGAELYRKLLALPDRLATNVMRGATAKGANVFRDEVRHRAPILDLEKVMGSGGPHEPALLLKSIIARRMRSRNRDEVRAGILILKEAFYWRFVEFGTRHARAYPFIRPAVDSTSTQAAQAVLDYARDRVAREAANG